MYLFLKLSLLNQSIKEKTCLTLLPLKLDFYMSIMSTMTFKHNKTEIFGLWKRRAIVECVCV